jgi:plasmid stabilization system protein ParE
MAKRKIVWTNTAARQRREILKYWADRNQNYIYASKLIEVTKSHLNVIVKNPKAFAWDISVYIIKLQTSSLLF